MNHHLNLFRFFNESTETVFIENNLSRAFALCLTNNSFFLNEYIRSIATDADYEYLFSSISDDTECIVDVQIDTATIEKEGYKTVYAIAMTADRNLNMDDFLNQIEIKGKKNITDITISIKDILFIIEVKRTGEDCKAQLFNQICPFLNTEGIKIIADSFSWQRVVKILEKIKHVQYLGSQNSIFINHFLELSEIKYPHWFDPKPFSLIPFSSQHGTTNFIQLEKRLKQALTGVTLIAGEQYQVLPFNDRLSISVPFGWASEVIPVFETYPDDIKEYISFYIWPGNTKQQGYSIYNNKSLDWVNKNSLSIDGSDYELDISYNIKFSHFMGKYISQINYYNHDVVKPLHTTNNFQNQSGKWHREIWGDFEILMDSHFKKEFNWREYCKWDDSFLNSGKNFLFMSLGFEVRLDIPFTKLKNIDKSETDITLVSEFLNKIIVALNTLIK